MNTVTPQTTTPPALVPAGAPTTTKPALPTSKPPAPPEAKCDTFTPRAGGLFDFGQKAWRNMLSIFGPLPANPPTPSPCPSD